MISDTERENNFLKIKYEMAEEFSLQLKRQLKNVEDTLQKSRREFYDVVIEKEGIVNELEMLKLKVKRMEEEKSNADFLLECKNKEICSLQDVVKSLTSRLESSGKNEMENTIKSEDIRMRELSLELQERRIQQEREFYQKQMDVLENEINQHVKEAKDSQRQKTTQILDLESRLDLANDQIKRLSEESNHFKQLSDKKDQHIDDLALKIRELNEATNQMEIHFQTEIKELKNIIEMNENSLRKEREMAKRLVDELGEMQKTLIQSHEAQQELDQTLKQFNEGYEKNLNSKNEVIAELEEEITKLKAEAAAKKQEEYEGQMDIYFPSASSTCKIFNSNMSLSEFYHEYRLLSHRLEEEASEKNRLKEQVRELIAEAEQRGPFIHRKINENRRNAQIINELQGAVSSLISEKEQLIADKNESEQLVKHLQRELQRQEQHVVDSRRQVLSLLKTVCRLQNIPMNDRAEPLVDVRTGSANSIITQHLITYSDLEDLQSKNECLIVSIRDLGARCEELEKQLVEKDAVSKQDMEKVQEEVKKLMEERQKQTMILEELTQKRDGPRSRLSIDSEMRSPIKSSVSSARNTVDDTLSDMKATLKKMADETSVLHAEYDQKIKDLNEEIAGLREEITNLQAEKAKIESLNEFHQEKTKVLQANFETVKKENSAYNERNNKLCQKLAKLEGTNNLLKTELTEIKAVRKRLESSILTIQSERDLLRNNERLLTQERDSLRREYEEKSKLISTFQSIQANFQRLESESAKGLHLQIEKLERELASAKSLLDSTEKDKRETVQSYSKQIRDLQLKINEEIHNNARINEELALAKQKLHEAEVELRVLKAAQANQPPPPQPQPTVQPQPIIRVKEKLVDNPKLVAKIKELESTLDASRKEVVSLKAELQTSATRAEKLKAISDQARQRLGLLVQQKKDLTKEKDDLAKKVRELEAAIAAPPPRRLNLRNESNEELNRKLAEVEGKLNQMTTLNKSLNNDKEILQKEQNDLKAKITSLENVISQEKNSAKESYHEVARKLEEAESKMNALISLNNSLSNEKDNMVKEMDELRSKISSLEQQISLEKESAQNLNRELTRNLEESQQRIKSIVAVNESLTSKNMTLVKTSTGLKAKINSLENQISEETSNLAKLKSQYEGQVRQLQRLYDESKEKLVQQNLELDSLHNQIASSQSSSISMPSISSSSNPSNSATPVRHPVLPQKQESSSPSITIPTASIRPLVAPGPSSSPRVSARSTTPNVRATVVPVQPEPHQFEQVPQATVTPTHSQTVVVPPSSATPGPMSTTDSTPYDSSIYPSSSRHLGLDSGVSEGNADSKLVSSSQDSLPEPIESTSSRDQDTHLGHKRQRLTQSDSPDSKNSKKIRVEEEVVVESIGQDELSLDADADDDTARNQNDERPYPSEDDPKHLRDDTTRSDEDAQVESQEAEEEAEDEECLDDEEEEEEEEEEEALENDEEEGEGDGEDMEGLMHSRPESMHSEVDDEAEDEEADEHDVDDEEGDDEEDEEEEEHEDEVDGSEDPNQAVEEESADDDIVILNSDSEESGEESQPAQQNFPE